MNAVRLNTDESSMRLLSDLWVEDHVFKNLDLRFKTFYGAHKLFEAIENGAIRVYAVFDDNNKFLGCVFGYADHNNDFIAHVVFMRGVDVAHCCKLCDDCMKQDYANDGIIVKHTVGFIPETNRAAIRMAKRYGSQDHGVSDLFAFMNSKGEIIKCHKLVKDV